MLDCCIRNNLLRPILREDTDVFEILLRFPHKASYMLLESSAVSLTLNSKKSQDTAAGAKESILRTLLLSAHRRDDRYQFAPRFAFFHPPRNGES